INVPFQTQLFLAADPLVAIASLISGNLVILTLVMSIAMVLVTVLFGRVFCGYACPLGTIIDMFSFLDKIPVRKPGRSKPSSRTPETIRMPKKSGRQVDQSSAFLRSMPLVVLMAVAVTSLFGVGILLAFVPIVLLTRFSTTFIFPAINYLLNELLDVLYTTDFSIPFLNYRTIDEISLKISGILIFNNGRVFAGAASTGLFFMLIIGLNVLGARFWCSYVCPLGGLLALAARIPIAGRFYRRRVDTTLCTECRKCESVCTMGAVRDKGKATDNSRCLMCTRCRDVCTKGVVSYGLNRSKDGLESHFTPESPSRRAAVITLASSVAAVYGVRLGDNYLLRNRSGGNAGNARNARKSSISSSGEQFLVRPPGALKETDFLDACTRCGECAKVCPSNTLRPAILQYGVESVWSPHLVFDSGACEFGCNECGKVCPTGAIESLTLDKKQKLVIGTAVIDRKKCIPWETGCTCMVCQELCPLPKKAIEFETDKTSAGKPYMVDDLCIGCGVCEKHCPVKGEKAIRVKGLTGKRTT
ncbi:MAG: 4Fe-4S dicluster domain-containing protein, partial [Rubrobacteridae bacterium]|nr:4Fe-4S dicluster domain-containing protein [Rubrobacteridae bacterium]